MFHEAGHTLFSLFPYWLEIAGGSILQVAVPFFVSVAAFVKRQAYVGSLVLLWVGQSLANVTSSSM